jgi:hypothetical protein
MNSLHLPHFRLDPEIAETKIAHHRVKDKAKHAKKNPHYCRLLSELNTYKFAFP